MLTIRSQERPAPQAAPGWTTGALVAFWVPLALSWTMMIVAQPIAAIAISRLADPEVQLAAYGVTFDLAFLLESPIIMLLSVSVALTRDQASFRLLRRVTGWVAGVATAIFLVVAFTPAYDLVVRGAMGVPEAVAAEARPALRLLLPWIGAIAWRRFLQGPLISAGHTRVITLGTLIRLVVLAVVLGAGVAFPVLPGAMLGALALSVSVVAESIANTLWALPVVRRLPAATEASLSVGAVFRFCAPLMATDVMRTIVRPAVTAGVARAALAPVSLAAWPVAASLITLVSAPAMSFQEVTVAVIHGRDAYRRVRRFIAAVGLILITLTALATWSPLLRAYLVTVVDLPGALLDPVIAGMRIMLPLPLLMALRNLFRGVLIRRRFTVPIQLAMGANAVVLFGALAVGVRAQWTGIVVAGTASVAAQVAEVVVLYLFSRMAERELT
ncbi:MAG: hypothetical protein QN147_06500 [Armatimonadota bacterium]|nr:hypothetical protein [Armatimonadota bacterium]